MPTTSNNTDCFATTVGGSGGFSSFYGDGLFGDGSDGDATITNTTTLLKETYYNNLTISGSGVLKPAGFRFFVKGTLTIDAGCSINDDGRDEQRVLAEQRRPESYGREGRRRHQHRRAGRHCVAGSSGPEVERLCLVADGPIQLWPHDRRRMGRRQRRWWWRILRGRNDRRWRR